MTDSGEQPVAGWRRWLLIAVIALGVAGLAFAIGRFSTFGATSSVVTPSTDSADAGFARDMQLHHAQAIDMAMTIYRKTDDEELRILAYDIATSQAEQKGQMYDWLVKWGLSQSGGPLMSWMTATDGGHDHGVTATGEALTDEELREAMGMASDDELRELDAATGQTADCLFLELMIRHHQGAIPMAEALLDLGSDPRAQAVAEAMKNGQTAEIDAMESMQSRLQCAG
ncbi:DUF305 domain-containing protein [Microbacterium aoyamense]|uniref:DUF305 domain-containing protein n=1 Tax=Microbacterium aoyamense TaxID=344166 RepID=A0ABP5B9P9_9MICO|nr:DUF305 domain-containing protein [Microbacterium aoyamense]